MNNRLSDIVHANGWEHSPENIKVAGEVLKNMYLSYNRENVLSAFASHVASQKDGEWITESHNPSAVKKEDTPPPPQKDFGTHAIEQIMAFENIKI